MCLPPLYAARSLGSARAAIMVPTIRRKTRRVRPTSYLELLGDAIQAFPRGGLRTPIIAATSGPTVLN